MQSWGILLPLQKKPTSASRGSEKKYKTVFT
nr:MAG TPA: hypothetical protein [Caudoviricetes sp.]